MNTWYQNCGGNYLWLLLLISVLTYCTEDGAPDSTLNNDMRKACIQSNQD